MKQRLSLKGRALQLLAQREQSAVELKRKLSAHAERLARDQAEEEPPADVNAQVDAVLEWLVAGQLASDERFAESRVHARSSRFGNLRIRQELALHGVAAAPELNAELQATEFERCWQVWQRKFGDAAAHAPVDPAAQAKQARFLAGRGFSPEVIRRVLRGAARGRVEG